MSSAGYGQYRPTFKNDTEDHRRLNRKVQIVIENRQTSAEESEK
jgi:chemotaxis protein MotB